MHPTLQAIIEIRDELREFRAETRTTLGEHSHRLNVVEVNIVGLKSDVGELKSDVSDLKSDVGRLLGIVPALNERLDRLEAGSPPSKTRQ